MSDYKLFMILIGCKPPGRNTEQHDVYFGIAKELRDLVPEIKAFWRGASPLHLDGWRVINNVDGYKVSVVEKSVEEVQNDAALFFLNLGGYKPDHLEEFHYKMVTVAPDRLKAAATAKQTAFFKHTGFGKDATAHIDDRYGVDVDDIYEIKEILTAAALERFALKIVKWPTALEADPIHLGYFKLHEL